MLDKRIIAIGGGKVMDIVKLLTIKRGKHAQELFEKKISYTLKEVVKTIF